MIQSDYNVMIQPGYKVEIDAPNIAELISETFDGAWNLMTPNSIIFGSIIPDAIAGFNLTGSLDILVIQGERHRLLRNLRMSNKWIEEDIIKEMSDKWIEEDVIKEMSDKRAEDDAIKIIPEQPTIQLSPSLARSCIISKQHNSHTPTKVFVNQDNRKIQIITVPDTLFGSPTLEMLGMARDVDFKCYGFVMSIDGKIYEIIEGAYNDCLEKKLRINLNENVNIKHLNNKIEKLVNRGWKSEINIEEVKHHSAKIKRTKKRKSKKLQINTHPNVSVSKNITHGRISEDTVNMHISELLKSKTRMDVKLPELYYFESAMVNAVMRNFRKVIKLYGIRLINSDVFYMKEHNIIRIVLRKVGPPTIDKLRRAFTVALLDHSEELKRQAGRNLRNFGGPWRSAHSSKDPHQELKRAHSPAIQYTKELKRSKSSAIQYTYYVNSEETRPNLKRSMEEWDNCIQNDKIKGIERAGGVRGRKNRRSLES